MKILEKWYVIYELNGNKCSFLNHGWASVSKLIQAGKRIKFRGFHSKKKAQLFREQIWEVEDENPTLIRVPVKEGKPHN